MSVKIKSFDIQDDGLEALMLTILQQGGATVTVSQHSGEGTPESPGHSILCFKLASGIEVQCHMGFLEGYTLPGQTHSTYYPKIKLDTALTDDVYTFVVEGVSSETYAH